MKAEQYLEVLLDIVDILPDYEKEHFNKAVSKRLNKEDVYEMGIGGRVGYLINEMRTEIYDYEVKHSGNGKILSLAKKVLKRSQRRANKNFHYVRKIGDYAYFSDGSMAIKTPQDLKSLEAPEELLRDTDGFDFNGLFSTISSETGAKLSLPNLAKLKTLHKVEKAKFNVESHPKGEKFIFFYNFGYNLPTVNGERLIEIMDAFPNITLYSGKSGVGGNLYGITEDGSNEAILCPVRKIDRDGKQSDFGYTNNDVENVTNG